MIKVIHKKYKDKYDNVFYVGRGSELGNPYTSIQDRETKAEFVVESRKESIECYQGYLEKTIENKNIDICNILNKIYLLSLKEDVYLSCYCKPKSCHADVIKEIIDSKLPGEKKENDNQLRLFG